MTDLQLKNYFKLSKEIYDKLKDQPDHFINDINILIPPNNNDDINTKFRRKISERRGPALGKDDFIYLFPNNINEDSYIDFNGNLLETPIATLVCIKNNILSDCTDADRTTAAPYMSLFKQNLD